MPAPKGNKHALGNPGGGRETLYKPEFADLAFKICLLGATDEKLADILGVGETTINAWKNRHIEFSEALKRGKDIADAEIAHSLYHRAKGYSHNDVYPSSYQGAITLTPIIKHYPPDTTAASLWLRNRQPKDWRDKTDHTVSNPDGTPLDLVVNFISAPTVKNG